MKKFAQFSSIFLVVFGVLGCNSKPAEPDKMGRGLNAVSTEGSNSSSDSNKPSEGSNEPQEPGMDLAKIPASLKGDAFEYYGLSRTEPIKMTVTQSGSSEPAEQTVKLTKVDTAKAEFTISNTGGLSRLGEVLVSLGKEGIRVVSVNGQKADADTFELPNGLVKGKKWPFKLQSGELKLTGSNVVSGTESVTTAVGTYTDAILVVSTATGQQGGQKVELKSKQWLVKGRGQVKAEITNVSGKTTQTVTMAESK